MYKSHSSGEECTAAQLIAEILITRQEQKKKNIVPHKFWNLPKYKKRYIFTIIQANGLLKLYSGDAIIAALMANNWIAWANANALPQMIKKEEARIAKLKIDLESVTETVHKETKPMKVYGKQSMLSKLRDLDGKREKSEED
jgi:hypothetical protein